MGLSDILKDLFSRKLIIVKKSGKLKLLDTNHQQSAGGSLLGKYRSLKTSRYNSGYSLYNGLESIESLRTSLYSDYELMDTSAIIASALDIYADEVTAENTDGEILKIITDDEDLKKILYNLFYDILNIDFNLWHWTRGLCKHGDAFLIVDAAPGVGVVDVAPVYPTFIRRLENYTDRQMSTNAGTIFVYEGDPDPAYKKNQFDETEIIHFRMLSDTNFLPYGKSIIEGGRKTFKKLHLMEDAMLLHRIMRAPERRKFKIDVGTIPPEEIDNYIEEIAANNKKTPYIDPQTGDYNLEFNLQNMLEDYYMPVRGDKSGTDIETLDGLSNEGAIEDIEYVRKQLLAYLKIPKAYLNYDEDTGGKAVLASEDIRFARTIERIQRIVIGELFKLASIHLLAQGYDKSVLLKFTLELTSPSIIYERQKVSLLAEKFDLIKAIQDTKMFSRDYIYQNILNLTSDEIRMQKNGVIDDAKETFRLMQIENEGNDPRKTGKSYGTKHDLAVMSWGNNDDEKGVTMDPNNPDGRADNTGRPDNISTVNTRKDVMGEDPLGDKEIGEAHRVSTLFKDDNEIEENNTSEITMLSESTFTKYSKE